MHIRHVLPQLVAFLLVCDWIPSTWANQRLLDRVNRCFDDYTERATGEMRKIGFRILHEQVYHHTLLLDHVSRSNVAILSDIEHVTQTAAVAGKAMQDYIDRIAKRTERKVRRLRADTLAKVHGIMDEASGAADATAAQVRQVAFARRLLGSMPPIFEDTVRKTYIVLAESKPRFSKVQDHVTVVLMKLHAEAIKDKKGAHRREFAAKYMLHQEQAIDIFENAMKEAGQRILHFWNEYSARSFDSKPFLRALRNVDD